MVPVILLSIALFLFAAVAVVTAPTFQFRNLRAESVAEFDRRVSKLILGMLSYPLMLVLIVVLHVCSCVLTLIRYTAGRVGGEPMTKIVVRTTFD